MTYKEIQKNEVVNAYKDCMVMCRRAAEMLGAKFKLKVNGSKVL